MPMQACVLKLRFGLEKWGMSECWVCCRGLPRGIPIPRFDSGLIGLFVKLRQRPAPVQRIDEINETRLSLRVNVSKLDAHPREEQIALRL